MKKKSIRKVDEDYIIPRVGFPVKPYKTKWSIYREIMMERKEDKYHRAWKNVEE